MRTYTSTRATPMHTLCIASSAWTPSNLRRASIRAASTLHVHLAPPHHRDRRPRPSQAYTHTHSRARTHHAAMHACLRSHRAQRAARLGSADCRGEAALRHPRRGSAGTKPASAPPLDSIDARPLASPTVTSANSPKAAPAVRVNMPRASDPAVALAREGWAQQQLPATSLVLLVPSPRIRGAWRAGAPSKWDARSAPPPVL